MVLVAAILLSDHLSKARQDRTLSAELVGIPPAGIPVAINDPDTQRLPERPLRDPAPSPVVDRNQGGGGDIKSVVNLLPPDVGPKNEIAAIDPDSVKETLPLDQGKEQIVTIKPGDGLYKICARLYSNGGLYKQLEAYNQDTPGFNPSNLKVGSTVRVPPKDVLLGKTRLGPGKAGFTNIKADETPETSPLPIHDNNLVEASKGKSYKVVAGDSGIAIARKTLGDKGRWEDIARVNPGIDPRTLKIGYELKIPAK